MSKAKFGFCVALMCGALFTPSWGQEDELGAWYMYWGANRIADNFSIHSESQVRLNNVFDNKNQFFVRFGLNWHVKDELWITGGYGYFVDWVFTNPDQLQSREHRIWQQAIVRSPFGKLYMEHRYRIEQRWIGLDGNYDFKGRARYRLYFEYPFNKPTREKGALTGVSYNEIFLNTDVNNVFDQNRLYFALGYFLRDPLSLQFGYLLQTIGGANRNRLQFAVVFNPDFRKTE